MKVWLITGCSSGFGKELAKKALQEGDAVVATARNTSSLDELSGEVLKLQLDVTRQDQIESVIKEAKAWKGKIDVLVNNAGVGNLGSIEDTPKSTWEKLYSVNVFGLVAVTQEVLPIMREQQSGHILNISSVAGLMAMAGFGAYCSTKFAVEAITESLAQEVGPLGIKVTSIEPGAFKTKFIGNVVLDEVKPHYEQTVGATKNMLQQFETTAPGDPAKAAKIMFDIVQKKEPPLRILLGKDAFTWGSQKVEAMLKNMKEQQQISTSTDFD